MKIEEAAVWRVKLPLKKPYKISVFTYHHFDAVFLQLRGTGGQEAWGETIIREGYNHETPQSAEELLGQLAPKLIGSSLSSALLSASAQVERNPYALSAAVIAVEQLIGNSCLNSGGAARIPLLAPISAETPREISKEVEELLKQGFKTIKVKVGFRPLADLDRVNNIRRAASGAAMLRLDANNAYSKEDGQFFASKLDPRGIELLEQPCGADDWEANAEVAKVSTVPVMLDEPIWLPSDVDRAATLQNVRYAKIKLKKAGGLQRLLRMIGRMKEKSLAPVLGDGVATGLGNWMEACVARDTLQNAGEMNGFLKLSRPILVDDLQIRDGAIELPKAFRPVMDQQALMRLECRVRKFSRNSLG
jgi:L-alanine-DL-glutamate epimerase-like enolase superfamily enzyme